VATKELNAELSAVRSASIKRRQRA
jgi:hypothetical protein